MFECLCLINMNRSMSLIWHLMKWNGIGKMDLFLITTFRKQFWFIVKIIHWLARNIDKWSVKSLHKSHLQKFFNKMPRLLIIVHVLKLENHKIYKLNGAKRWKENIEKYWAIRSLSSTHSRFLIRVHFLKLKNHKIYKLDGAKRWKEVIKPARWER